MSILDFDLLFLYNETVVFVSNYIQYEPPKSAFFNYTTAIVKTKKNTPKHCATNAT